MKVVFSYLLVAFLWLLHWLPLPILRALGWGLGGCFSSWRAPGATSR